MNKDILEFEFTGKALEKYEDTITDLLEKWLVVENGLDVLVTSFVSFDYGTLSIDCHFDIKNKQRALDLTIELLNKLHIKDYSLI